MAPSDMNVPTPTFTTGTVKKSSIPATLVRDTMGGVSFYYTGFRSVMANKKTLEEIMAESTLQNFIKVYLVLLAGQKMNLFWVFSGEIGLHLKHGENLSLDFALVEKDTFSPARISSKYLDYPPRVVVEIDVNVEVKSGKFNAWEDYIIPKINKLHEFGTKKVIWIFTKSKKIVLAEAGRKWETFDWDKDVELVEGIVFNIATHLKESGILPN